MSKPVERFPGASHSKARTAWKAINRPSAMPTKASAMLSVSIWRAKRHGEAPSAVRTANSRARAEARANKRDRKSTRLNSSHEWISYAVFCLKKKKQQVAKQKLRKHPENSNESV